MFKPVVYSQTTMSEKKTFKRQSYIERSISSSLIECEIRFRREEQVSETDKRRWDFFLLDHNAVVEGDGQQHFYECKKFSRNLKEEQKNDIEKTKMALAAKRKVIRLDFLLSEEQISSCLLEGM